MKFQDFEAARVYARQLNRDYGARFVVVPALMLDLLHLRRVPCWKIQIAP